MVTFLIVFILCIIFGVVAAISSFGSGFAEGFSGGIFGVAIGLLLGILVVLAVSIVMSGAETSFDMIGSQEIIALKDNNNVTGSFYLGSGTIENEMYYYYVVKEDKGMKINKIAANSCYINYTDSNFRIETYAGKFTESWRNMWAIPLLNDYYIIYIPAGSITTEFSIDLE